LATCDERGFGFGEAFHSDGPPIGSGTPFPTVLVPSSAIDNDLGPSQLLLRLLSNFMVSAGPPGRVGDAAHRGCPSKSIIRFTRADVFTPQRDQCGLRRISWQESELNSAANYERMDAQGPAAIANE
jgi:hypothetical protein